MAKQVKTEHHISSCLKISLDDYQTKIERTKALIYKQLSDVYYKLSKGFIISNPILIQKSLADGVVSVDFIVSTRFVGERKARQLKFKLPRITKPYFLTGWSKDDFINLPEEVLFNCEIALTSEERDSLTTKTEAAP
ncbi:MAG: hypothetical protein WC307_06615 [Candidatus Nanoarchaeia archaeon]|jgi:hypothetical protein